MFRKWNRFLAFLLSLALVITTVGSDLATARVYADEGEIVTEEAPEQEEAAPEIFEEIPETEEEEVVPPVVIPVAPVVSVLTAVSPTKIF